VNQTFDVVFRAVPRQSFRARSKCDRLPGPSDAARDAHPAIGENPAGTKANARPTATPTLPSRPRPEITARPSL